MPCLVLRYRFTNSCQGGGAENDGVSASLQRDWVAPDTYPVFKVLGGLVLGVGHVILAVPREPQRLWTAKTWLMEDNQSPFDEMVRPITCVAPLLGGGAAYTC